MIRLLLLITTITMALSITACDQMSKTEQVAASAESVPETEEQKTFYALGLAVAQSLSQFDMNEEELALVKAGLTDSLTGQEAAVDLSVYQPKFAALGQSRLAAAAEKTKMAAADYMVEMAAKPGAESFESGLVMFELTAGDGEQPAATDKVTVHYHGTLTDGTVFDSSVERGTPASFPLNGVIPCWTEGVQKIKVGGKSKLICPSDIAYGDRGRPPQIPPGATLVFDVELLGIE